MTEEFLQYVWANSLFTSTVCVSTKGKRVEILNVGFQNRDAGPDFFNAKVRINDVVQVGNVEIHQKGSDWFRHAHEKDLVVNVTTSKKLTNMRASGSDEKARLIPPVQFSLEEALEYIKEDEYVEVTPKAMRMRKVILDEIERKRANKI